ncbi:hypothetical protein BDF21DRAFT_393854 [Thamnidium elegans]|nr:hypothetical protein BDF21DRAFT_393854 [Thamnidium elegans]
MYYLVVGNSGLITSFHTLNPTFPSARLSLMTVVFTDRNEALDARQWLNCDIFVGYATASTACNNTLCETHITSEITPYQDTNYGLKSFMEEMQVNGTMRSLSFKSRFEPYKSYVYVILWKWPFWLTAMFILVSWALCMFTMWVTPESRVMSVEWLRNQYITRDQWGYISGRDLVQAYDGSFFQIVDQNSDEDIGNIVISKIETKDDTENMWVHHRKRYQ